MNPHLKSIVDRLKKGEQVSSTDKAIYELRSPIAKKVSNMIKAHNANHKRSRERLEGKFGDKLTDYLLEVTRQGTGEPSIVNHVKKEKHCRMILIDKLEELPD